MTEQTQGSTATKPSEEITDVVIRLAGDSGDGMQLTGTQFTAVSALAGNDLATLPDFPAEIRAPAGTLPGVSAFQVRISSEDISTPGDIADVLVAMNPAALRSELSKLRQGGMVIVNSDGFEERDLDKAGYDANPLTDDSLADYQVVEVPMTDLTVRKVKELGVKGREAERSKNFFALGLLCWMYSRNPDDLRAWIEDRFAKDELIRDANITAFEVGWSFGETTELIPVTRSVAPMERPPGTYRNINGNTGLAWGIIAAAQLSGLPTYLGSYPITPASDILHELAKHPEAGIRTFQAEDEIAAAASSVGAAFAGDLAWTTTSGPGMALKGETIGLAISLELPLVIVDIQRGGPSTGLPTKTEQSDLTQALFGRHGESPLPVIAASRPADSFECAIQAAEIAIKYRTPVILLSDGYIANSSEPWCLPDVEDLPDLSTTYATGTNHTGADGVEEFWPYLRDPDTLARPWAIPGTPGLEHRIGGIEKADGSGDISYDPDNHQAMTDLRAAKVAGVARGYRKLEVTGDSEDADLLVVGWGSTWGAIAAAVERVRSAGGKVAHVHLRNLNPLPEDLGDIVRRYPKVMVPELNLGQLSMVLRSKYLIDAQSVSKVAGLPFTAGEIESEIHKMLGDDWSDR
ncbi:MAG: 2-oxoacid:acceptor oxidoreductase subunit alpha [Microthrixaceae bacterium]|nr:2-oxoacid:acceptor oxidoreductase subunit alpha [Microthrixaceae bacterium]